MPLDYRLSQLEPGERRVVVVGTSGSGKTTLARAIAARLGIPHVELDALHWEPNWTEAPLDQFRERVKLALSGEEWAVDGNYSKARDLIWPRATLIIWLDYSLPVIMGRLGKRTFSRLLSREELWSGNRESLRTTLLSRDSILWWALTTYRKNRQRYPALLALPENRHLKLLHFQNPAQAQRWLDSP